MNKTTHIPACKELRQAQTHHRIMGDCRECGEGPCKYPVGNSALRAQADQQAQPVAGDDGISRVYQICNRYESGYGHGLKRDGFDLSKTPHADAEMGEAYQIGYEAGYENFTSPPAQPADQQTHNVEDSPEYRLGFAAGRESYARHYKCGCTAFPADAPAYCPIHSASQEEQGK